MFSYFYFTYISELVIVIHRKGLCPCVTICIDNAVGVAWPHMQSYVYGIIIDCIYYDVGNETTTEIVVERTRRKRIYCYIEFDEAARIRNFRLDVYRSANVRL